MIASTNYIMDCVCFWFLQRSNCKLVRKCWVCLHHRMILTCVSFVVPFQEKQNLFLSLSKIKRADEAHVRSIYDVSLYLLSVKIINKYLKQTVRTLADHKANTINKLPVNCWLSIMNLISRLTFSLHFRDRLAVLINI